MERFLAKEFGKITSIRVDIPTGLDADGIQLAFEDTTNTVHLTCRHSLHKLHDGLSIAREEELAVGFVLIRTDFGQLRIGGNASRHGDLGFCKDFGTQLADGLLRAQIVILTVWRQIKVSLVTTSALEIWVV